MYQATIRSGYGPAGVLTAVLCLTYEEMSAMPVPSADYLPDDHDVLGVLLRRGCVSLRVLCEEFWPQLRWRRLYEGEASVAEELLPAVGVTRVLWVWQALGRLMAMGRVQVAGQDPDEVDNLAAVSFEMMGQRRGYAAA